MAGILAVSVCMCCSSMRQDKCKRKRRGEKKKKRKRKRKGRRSKQARYATISQSVRQKSNPRHRVCVTSNSHCKRPNSQLETTSFDNMTAAARPANENVFFLGHQLRPSAASLGAWIEKTKQGNVNKSKERQARHASCVTSSPCPRRRIRRRIRRPRILPIRSRSCVEFSRLESQGHSLEQERRRGKTNGGVLCDSGKE